MRTLQNIPGVHKQHYKYHKMSNALHATIRLDRFFVVVIVRIFIDVGVLDRFVQIFRCDTQYVYWFEPKGLNQGSCMP